MHAACSNAYEAKERSGMTLVQPGAAAQRTKHQVQLQPLCHATLPTSRMAPPDRPPTCAPAMPTRKQVNLAFPYPVTVSWLGLLTTTVASFLALRLFLKPSDRRGIRMSYYFARIMPCGFFMAVAFLTGAWSCEARVCAVGAGVGHAMGKHHQRACKGCTAALRTKGPQTTNCPQATSPSSSSHWRLCKCSRRSPQW